ncbi:MAG: hypothetical protein H0V92_04350 [Pseudonocardiales bacterium]|nr:hypothetical protein [Pseudonocardiales bacterium]
MNRPEADPTWTTFYDSTGQVPSLVATSSKRGLGVQYLADRLTLDLQGDGEAPFAGSFGLSGAVTLTLPEDLPLGGLLLVVDGSIDRTAGTQAVVTCAIGHGSRTREWPLASAAGTPTPDPSAQDGHENGGDDTVTDEDFRIECFVSDFNPSSVGVPPFPPFPPVPITLGVQARRRAVDEVVQVSIMAFELIVLSTP